MLNSESEHVFCRIKCCSHCPEVAIVPPVHRLSQEGVAKACMAVDASTVPAEERAELPGGAVGRLLTRAASGKPKTYCYEDPATCPLGRWAPEFLEQFKKTALTDAEKAEQRKEQAAQMGRKVEGFATYLKSTSDAEAESLLVEATANGLPLEVARQIAMDRGLTLDAKS